MELVVDFKILQHAVNFHTIWTPVAYGFAAVNMPSDRKLHFHKLCFFSKSETVCEMPFCDFFSQCSMLPCQVLLVVCCSVSCPLPFHDLLEHIGVVQPQLWGVENAMWLFLADCSHFLFCSQLLNRSSDLIVSYMKLAQKQMLDKEDNIMNCVCLVPNNVI